MTACSFHPEDVTCLLVSTWNGGMHKDGLYHKDLCGFPGCPASFQLPCVSHGLPAQGHLTLQLSPTELWSHGIPRDPSSNNWYPGDLPAGRWYLEDQGGWESPSVSPSCVSSNACNLCSADRYCIPPHCWREGFWVWEKSQPFQDISVLTTSLDIFILPKGKMFGKSKQFFAS